MSTQMMPVDAHSELPLADQVEQALRNAIQHGRFRPHDRLPTVRELSEQLRVSKSTVSNVIARLVKSGLLLARQGRGTFVAGEAVDDAPRPTLGNLGLYWDGARSLIDAERYYLEIYQALVNAASRHGCHLILLPGSGHTIPIVDRVAALRQDSSLSGVLCLVTQFVNQEAVKGIQGLGLPVVLVDGMDESLGADGIMLDNARGMGEAMAALLDLGHRRIAYVGGLSDTPSAVERLATYENALTAAGIEPDPQLIRRIQPGVDGGRVALQDFLPRKPTAIVTFNSNLAEGILAEARTLGIAVPEELSIVGFGASARRVDAVDISSVVLDPEDMASAALEALRERIRGMDEPARRISIKTFLRDNGTVAPPCRGNVEL